MLAKCDPILALADRIQELTRDLSKSEQRVHDLMREVASLHREKEALLKEKAVLEGDIAMLHRTLDA